MGYREDEMPAYDPEKDKLGQQQQREREQDRERFLNQLIPILRRIEESKSKEEYDLAYNEAQELLRQRYPEQDSQDSKD